MSGNQAKKMNMTESEDSQQTHVQEDDVKEMNRGSQSPALKTKSSPIKVTSDHQVQLPVQDMMQPPTKRPREADTSKLVALLSSMQGNNSNNMQMFTSRNSIPSHSPSPAANLLSQAQLQQHINNSAIANRTVGGNPKAKWEKIEEIILFGCVAEHFFSMGSFGVSKPTQLFVNSNNSSINSTVMSDALWTQIENLYKSCLQHAVSGNSLSVSTLSELAPRSKQDLKQKYAQLCDARTSFESHLRLWTKIYNVNGQLINQTTLKRSPSQNDFGLNLNEPLAVQLLVNKIYSAISMVLKKDIEEHNDHNDDPTQSDHWMFLENTILIAAVVQTFLSTGWFTIVDFDIENSKRTWNMVKENYDKLWFTIVQPLAVQSLMPKNIKTPDEAHLLQKYLELQKVIEENETENLRTYFDACECLHHPNSHSSHSLSNPNVLNLGSLNQMSSLHNLFPQSQPNNSKLAAASNSSSFNQLTNLISMMNQPNARNAASPLGVGNLGLNMNLGGLFNSFNNGNFGNTAGLGTNNSQNTNADPFQIQALLYGSNKSMNGTYHGNESSASTLQSPPSSQSQIHINTGSGRPIMKKHSSHGSLKSKRSDAKLKRMRVVSKDSDDDDEQLSKSHSHSTGSNGLHLNTSGGGNNSGEKANSVSSRPSSGLENALGLDAKQKRTKWRTEDLVTLWESIALHGNEWQKVKDSLTGRTYHQVKDKGKRLLHEHGWETGRSKLHNDIACEKAKSIATDILAKLRSAEL